MPVTAEEKEQFFKDLDATFGQVKRLRDSFRTYYESMRNAPTLPDWLPNDARARITELCAEQIGLHGVADAMALYIPIYQAVEAGHHSASASLPQRRSNPQGPKRRGRGLPRRAPLV